MLEFMTWVPTRTVPRLVVVASVAEAACAVRTPVSGQEVDRIGQAAIIPLPHRVQNSLVGPPRAA
jgi:hypothetical protein